MISFETLHDELIGSNFRFETPYGERILTYADYTASGKTLYFLERYMMELQKNYANTHTEDDMTGEVMTKILHKSESIIKKHINADENCYIIPSGSGATGAIETLAKILGIYVPPVVKARFKNIMKDDVPVVFIGPYEHHSNILIWEEGLAEVVEIDLTPEGLIDLNDLRQKLKDTKYSKRLKIGSISAASNVTGILSPVYEIAAILHENNALACFDFAACAPYIEINMNKDEKAYFDAIYLAPHKFLGGPGSSGILVINKNLYNNSLPPTVSGGGTVSYVSSLGHVYLDDVELREMSGTPSILQIIKSSLVFELKDYLGIDKIKKREHHFTKIVFNRLKNKKNIEILGPDEEFDRIPIFSIKIKHNDKFIHPKFAAKLINDLFGIQTRAGCSCAAPYGHRLLEISDETSAVYKYFSKEGIASVKPGWLRFNLHYIMSEEEVEFILKAIEFVSEFGYLFLNDYVVNIKSGMWRHKNKSISYKVVESFGIKESCKFIGTANKNNCEEESVNKEEYNSYFNEAYKRVEALKRNNKKLKTLDENKFQGQGWFYYVNSENHI